LANPGNVSSAVRVPLVARQSFREVVRAALGGTAVRIRVSNLTGSDSVRLTSFSIARGGTGASILANTRRRITFGGRSAVTLAKGASALSDPVGLSFGYAQRLAVTFAAPDYVGLPTSHLGFSTSYRSAPLSGDVTTDAAGTAFVIPEQATNFLTGVQAFSPGALGTVVAFGDSITDGVGSTTDAFNDYPDLLAARLHAAGLKMGVVNEGLSGAAAGSCPISSTVFGDSAVSRFRRDVTSWPHVRSTIVLVGGNDLRDCAWLTATDVEAALASVLRQAQAARIPVLLATYPPKVCWTIAVPAPCTPSMGEDQRIAMNTWIKAQRPRVSAILDWDGLLRDPTQPHEQGTQSGSADDVHPGPPGYALMTRSIPLFRLH
jgi:lysophospholipase L1-like esterase